MTRPNPAKSWERQPDEKPFWYDRFDTFRLLGPGRTVDAAFRAVTGSIKRAGGAWWDEYAARRWRGRAEDWDDEGWRVQAEEEESLRRAARARRLKLLAETREGAMKALQTANLGELTKEQARELLPTLRMLLTDVLRAERIETTLGLTDLTVREDETAEIDTRVQALIDELYK